MSMTNSKEGCENCPCCPNCLCWSQIRVNKARERLSSLKKEGTGARVDFEIPCLRCRYKQGIAVLCDHCQAHLAITRKLEFESKPRGRFQAWTKPKTTVPKVVKKSIINAEKIHIPLISTINIDEYSLKEKDIAPEPSDKSISYEELKLKHPASPESIPCGTSEKFTFLHPGEPRKNVELLSDDSIITSFVTSFTHHAEKEDFQFIFPKNALGKRNLKEYVTQVSSPELIAGILEKEKNERAKEEGFYLPRTLAAGEKGDYPAWAEAREGRRYYSETQAKGVRGYASELLAKEGRSYPSAHQFRGEKVYHPETRSIGEKGYPPELQAKEERGYLSGHQIRGEKGYYPETKAKGERGRLSGTQARGSRSYHSEIQGKWEKRYPSGTQVRREKGYSPETQAKRESDQPPGPQSRRERGHPAETHAKEGKDYPPDTKSREEREHFSMTQTRGEKGLPPEIQSKEKKSQSSRPQATGESGYLPETQAKGERGHFSKTQATGEKSQLPEKHAKDQTDQPPGKQAKDQRDQPLKRQAKEKRGQPPESEVKGEEGQLPDIRAKEQKSQPPETQAKEQRGLHPETQTKGEKGDPPKTQAKKEKGQPPDKQANEQRGEPAEKQAKEERTQLPKTQITGQKGQPPGSESKGEKGQLPETQAKEQKSQPPETQAKGQRDLPPETQTKGEKGYIPKIQAKEEKGQPLEKQANEQRDEPLEKQAKEERTQLLKTQITGQKGQPPESESKEEKGQLPETRAKEQKGLPSKTEAKGQRGLPPETQTKGERSYTPKTQAKEEKDQPPEKQAKEKTTQSPKAQISGLRGQPFESEGKGEKDQLPETRVKGQKGYSPETQTSGKRDQTSEIKSKGKSSQLPETQTREEKGQTSENKTKAESGHPPKTQARGERGQYPEKKTKEDSGEAPETQAGKERDQTVEKKSKGESGYAPKAQAGGEKDNTPEVQFKEGKGQTPGTQFRGESGVPPGKQPKKERSDLSKPQAVQGKDNQEGKGSRSRDKKEEKGLPFSGRQQITEDKGPPPIPPLIFSKKEPPSPKTPGVSAPSDKNTQDSQGKEKQETKSTKQQKPMEEPPPTKPKRKPCPGEVGLIRPEVIMYDIPVDKLRKEIKIVSESLNNLKFISIKEKSTRKKLYVKEEKLPELSSSLPMIVKLDSVTYHKILKLKEKELADEFIAKNEIHKNLPSKREHLKSKPKSKIFQVSHMFETVQVEDTEDEEETATTPKVIQYALSDRSYIQNGWTQLPSEKVVRKMFVYRSHPAQPEFDWFNNNKTKGIMYYETGEKLADLDDTGCGRWYYKNGRVALDYHQSENNTAQKRFMVYSSGEPDENGKTYPVTVLAIFDLMGNGIVFDPNGRIRLNYNQSEGTVYDQKIGPNTHWKWHSLNDPPQFETILVDTFSGEKVTDFTESEQNDTNIDKIEDKDMLAIEFDNFAKELRKKQSQKFSPFQIRIKTLKINQQFSLRIIDQTRVYLQFRDGLANLKMNIGILIDPTEVIDTELAEIGSTPNCMFLQADTDSLVLLQQKLNDVKKINWRRSLHENRVRNPMPISSADQMLSGVARPLRHTVQHACTLLRRELLRHDHTLSEG